MQNHATAALQVTFTDYESYTLRSQPGTQNHKSSNYIKKDNENVEELMNEFLSSLGPSAGTSGTILVR